MAVRFYNSEGRAKMIDELNTDAEVFEKLDEDIQMAMKPTRKKLGINEEAVAAHIEELMVKAKSGQIIE